MVKAILVMGGSGKRFGSDLPKQFHRIAGKRVYLHTLERFLEANVFEEILLVCSAEWKSEVEKEVRSYAAPIRVVQGGSTRQESSYLGLLACGENTDYVVIHDAVRPFVSISIIRENVEAVKQFQAIDTCIPSTDTLVHTPGGETIASIPKRSEYMRGQTPQSFAYPLILEAHRSSKGKEVSDDCSLVLALPHPIHVVAGSEENLKITTEIDLFLAEQIFRLQQKKILPSDASLAGKRIAITGGTGGIGQAIAAKLIEEGAIPLIIGRSSPEHPCDLMSADQVRLLFDKLGPIDGLINSVGCLSVKHLHELSPTEIEEQVRVNLLGPIYSCRHAQVTSGGHLITISSSSYSRGRKGLSVYASSKAALVNFMQSLAEERPDLKVNVVVPARTNTAMRRSNFPEDLPEDLLSPEQVAQEIIHLLKEEKLTGSIIEVRKK